MFLNEKRKDSYIEGMEKEYRRTFRAFLRFTSYKSKLKNQNLTDLQIKKHNDIIDKMNGKVDLMNKMLNRGDDNNSV